ncbi:MAG: hypothetical protein WAV56_03940 [Microgenomates group bacterium]
MLSDLFLLILFVASLVFRLFYVSNFNFAFTIDQARDMLMIRQVAVGHDPVFIGPVTSLNGVYLGPFWFYFNLLPFLIGGGDPTHLVYWLIIFFHFSVLIFFLYFRKINYAFAFWGSLFLLVSPRFFELTSYSLNANATPIFVVLFLVALDHALRSTKTRLMFILGLLAGIGLQIEAAFGILLLPLALLWSIFKKKKGYLKFLFGFLLTLTPQLLFEIKHRFQMTRTFISAFFGQSTILGDRLDLPAKLSDRWGQYFKMLLSSLPAGIAPWLFLLSLICLLLLAIRQRKWLQSAPTSGLCLSLITFSVIFYIAYPYGLKGWWLTNLTGPYLLLIASFLALLWQTKKFIPRLLSVIFLIYLIFVSLRFYQDRLHQKLTTRTADRALLLNQLDAIDWTYHEASGSGFRTYVFTPAVYDLNYQYLYWWYGLGKYGYLPDKVTYQDDVPEYIENKTAYWTNPRPFSGVTFLLLETYPQFVDREADWRQRYLKLCKTKDVRLTSAIVIEKVTSCKK